ncbi:MAG: sensor histidine kinase, partial [Pseudomonadota bacterium]
TYVQERLRDTLLDALYFGAGAALVAFFIAFSVLLNSKPARRYALFFFLLVVYHFYGRGYLGQFILSDRPELLLEATRIFQAVIVIAYLAFVSAFLDTRNQYPRLHRFIVFLIGVCVVVTALEKLVFWEWFEHLALFVAVVFAATCAFGAYVAIRDGKPGSGFFALGVAILFGYVGLGVVGAYTIFYDQQYIVTQVTLAAQLFDGMVFAAAIIRQTFALRHERDQALQAELAASREKLELNERLLAARDDLDDARRIADERRERLAMTSHDLLQPLTSLRLALEESRATAPELGDKLEAGLEYLNSILSTTLHESRPDKLPGNEADLDNPHEITPVSEAIPLQLILQNIARMFADEAHAKGLSFKTVPTSHSVLAEPVPLIRMASNLVSNAIKYTKSGGILVGARLRDGDVALEVWDTGPGLAQEEIKTLTERYRRGGHEGNEDGEGLGLASVADLAAAQGARLDIRSRPGRGSVFSISGLTKADCGS